MDCGVLSEDPLPTRVRILLAMGEDPPMGLVPNPKEFRTRIVLDLEILTIPATGFFQHHLAELYWVSPGVGRLEAGPLGGTARGLESFRA